MFSDTRAQNFVLNAYQWIYIPHFFSFLIWTTLSVHCINVASILLKISIIKLFFPIPCIHNPNT